MEMRADLLIVGAGMVGSALALALRHSGLQILLVDGGPLTVKPFAAPAPFEPRVSALSAASQRILERLGAWEGIAQRRATPYTDMQVWDGSGTGQIHFSAASVHAQVLGHIVEGIDQATAKKINKDIKDQKLKVKVTIEADKLRVSSASKDALQTVIQFLRDQDYGQPLQFTNYR